MPANRWPDTLPQPLMDGYTVEPVDQVLRSSVEGGLQKFRRLGYERLDHVTVAWKMTDDQYGLFRQWHSSAGWSIGGPANDFSGWSGSGATWTNSSADALPGADAWRLSEHTTTAAHFGSTSWTSTPANNTTVVSTISLERVSRNVRFGIIDKAGTFHGLNLALTSTAIASVAGSPSAYAVTARGDGWYRVRVEANLGTGATTPGARLQLLDASFAISFTGTTGAVLASEFNTRVKSRNGDLYGATDSSGKLVGADGGCSWFRIPLKGTNGAVAWMEARFDGPYRAKALPGMNWDVRASLEVRYI